MADHRGIAGLVLAGLLLAGCSSFSTDSSSPRGTTDGAATPADADPIRTAVAASIDAINATAAGPVAAQQSVFAGLTEPDSAAGQRACAPATITIRIDPVLADVRPVAATADSATPSASAGSSTDTADETSPVTEPMSSAAATRYQVPVLLEVYTGTVRTATDMTSLEFLVIGGVARTFPLCLV